MTEAIPEPPGDLEERGRAFWRTVQERAEPSLAETEMLIEVCRTLDLCEALQGALDAGGVTVEGSKGQARVHPAVGELRSARALLSRLLAQLEIPEGDGEVLPSPHSVRGRKAAKARWSSRPTGTATSDAARRAAATRWGGGQGA